MNERVKALWVSDLRSGRFMQGRGQLRKGDTYCCLGVLCERAVREGVIPPPEIETPESNTYVYVNDRSLLPMPVMEWAGLDSPGPDIPNGVVDDIGHENWTLVEANDEGLLSFEQIAKVIEEQL